jgi:hypothetical protein
MPSKLPTTLIELEADTNDPVVNSESTLRGHCKSFVVLSNIL